ncbi:MULTISPECIES: nitroreductase family protein [unclassified Sedimentibacter]|uniref:nitroreductase family protein n=1 Tax=unclassified Sedimentibacter TaxID=2649220 RepID=UPI0027DF9331|nr:nitroreductase family protein [Sedimentibacter sp. MB35-C1]WMJ76442.1 nitroreductase family protein [Sedimentibacter sp. MB35-C1]
MDNIYYIINNRSSCRNFSDREVSDECLEKILNAACKSPSAGGFQAYSIIKIKNSKTKKKLAELCRNQMFIEKAPVCLLFCIDYRRIKKICDVLPAPCEAINNFMDFWMAVLSTAICAHTACLAAEAENLKSVYVGNIINTVDKVSELLNIPKYVCPSVMVVLGYPKNKPVMSEKYNRTVLVHDEKYKDIEINSLNNEYENKYENWNMKPTKKLVDSIYDTCLKYNGIEMAEKFRSNALNFNKISAYQFWFGYYYLKQDDFLDLSGYVNYMKKQGFKWLE